MALSPSYFQDNRESLSAPKSASGCVSASHSRATGLGDLPSSPSERYSRSWTGQSAELRAGLVVAAGMKNYHNCMFHSALSLSPCRLLCLFLLWIVSKISCLLARSLLMICLQVSRDSRTVRILCSVMLCSCGTLRRKIIITAELLELGTSIHHHH